MDHIQKMFCTVRHIRGSFVVSGQVISMKRPRANILKWILWLPDLITQNRSKLVNWFRNRGFCNDYTFNNMLIFRFYNFNAFNVLFYFKFEQKNGIVIKGANS